MNLTFKKSLTIIFVVFSALIMLSISVYAEDHGESLNPNMPDYVGVGVWWNAEEVGTAWNTFYNAQVPYTFNESTLKRLVNNSGVGKKQSDGSHETLWETCKKSEFIYWYGSNKPWTDKYGIKYKKMSFYTQGRGMNVPFSQGGPYWMQPISGKAIKNWARYLEWSNNWETGNVHLVCSYAFSGDEKLKLFFMANSNTFIYDGSPKTVSGLHPETNISALKDGHSHNAVAERTAINPGEYNVTFNKPIRITDATGKDVSEEYDIVDKPGKLIIKEEDIIIPPPAEDPEVEWRCNDNKLDSATANVLNAVKGSEGFSPSGSPGLNRTERSRMTDAGYFAMMNKPPIKWESLSVWTSWKSQFESGSDTITQELDLQTSGVSYVLSQYGGVYNIHKELNEETYEVEHCQPQERYLDVEFEYGYEMYIPGGGRLYGEDRYGDEVRIYIGDEILIEDRYGELEGVVTDIYMAYEPEDDEVEITTNSGRSYWIFLEDIFYWEMRYEEWSSWEDIGDRIIWDKWGPSRSTKDFNYQILNVNCNKVGFKSVLSGLSGATDHSIADGDGGGSLSTKLSSGVGPGPLGKGTTGTSSFYNDGDSCDIFCTAASGLNVSSDISNNQGNLEKFQEVLNGEYINVPTNKKFLTFFRDNEYNEVRADIWYPKDTGLIDLEAYSGEKAIKTYGYIYSGSPDIELTTIAPIDTDGGIWGYNYDRITSVRNQKEWNGMMNRFKMKSQWSSYDGQPYKLGLNWKYNVSGENKVPKLVNGDEVLTETGIYTYYWDALCPFGNDNSSNTKAEIPQTPFVNRNTHAPAWLDPLDLPSIDKSTLKVFFTRSVSDN